MLSQISAETGAADKPALGAGEFIADVVKEVVSPPDSRFPALRNTPSTHFYQEGLVCAESDLSKVILSLIFDGDEEYFYSPNTDQLWRNGLDGQRSLAEAFMLFDGEEAAKEHLRGQNTKAGEAVIYSLRRDGARVIMEERARLVREGSDVVASA